MAPYACRHTHAWITNRARAGFQGPEIVVDDPDLNFGLVELGDEETMSLRIRNTSRMSAKWAISESEEHAVHSVTVREGQLADLDNGNGSVVSDELHYGRS